VDPEWGKTGDLLTNDALSHLPKKCLSISHDFSLSITLLLYFLSPSFFKEISYNKKYRNLANWKLPKRPLYLYYDIKRARMNYAAPI
jgi:hypothetical protein